MSATVATTRAARVGMVGGGQLARMTHEAALALDVEITVLAEEADAPAVEAGARLRPGAPDDLEALRALAAGADVVTFDHEHVPHELVETLEHDGAVVQPSAAAKLFGQDKLFARRGLAAAGFPVPAFAPVQTSEEVGAFAEAHGWPVVLKARRGGYDGRGVHVVGDASAVGAALEACRGEAVAEARVDIALEIAVLVARRPSGEAGVYPVVHTVQEDGMCREMVAPAPIEPSLALDAQDLARRIVEHVGATGVVAVELFVDTDGKLVVCELALRPHNAGHWTIEGSVTSQFEQHLRAVLDWPLGDTGSTAAAVATVNVVGRGDADPRARLVDALAVPGAHVHLYGKAPRDGRKLGHVTALAGTADDALAVAREAAARLVAA